MRTAACFSLFPLARVLGDLIHDCRFNRSLVTRQITRGNSVFFKQFVVPHVPAPMPIQAEGSFACNGALRGVSCLAEKAQTAGRNFAMNFRILTWITAKRLE